MDLNKETLAAIKKKQKSARDLEVIVKMLRTSPFFKNMQINKTQEFEEIARGLVHERFSANSTVFKYGDEGERFYFLLKG